MNHDRHVPAGPAPSFWHTRYAIGLLAFAAVALYFLLGEHRAHALGVLPYLLLLACPFLHFFMHRGHDHGSAGRSHGSGDRVADEQTPDRAAPTSQRHP